MGNQSVKSCVISYFQDEIVQFRIIAVHIEPLKKWFFRGSVLGGILPGILGITVLGGWFAGVRSLIQIRPEFVPMQFNTALGFLLFSAAFLGFIAGRTRLAMVLGGLVAALGFMTLTEYVFLIDLGIDELFMDHYITVATSHPGRMGPNTALCFVLSGSLIVVAVRGDCGSRSNRCLGMAGSMVAALGLIALFGYFSGIPTAYGWGRLTHMALHTSAGFIVVGSGISLRAFYIGFANDKGPPSWLPAFFGIGTLTVTILMWQALNAGLGETGSRLPAVVLLAGVISAGLLTLSIKLSLTAWIQADQLKLVNKELSKWELVFKHAEWGIIITEPVSGRIVSVNASMANMHGYTEEELLDLTLADIFSEEDRALLPGRGNQLHEADRVEYESMHVRKDGSLFPALTNVNAIFDENNNVLYRAVNVLDMTERKKTEGALRLTQFAVDKNADSIYWVRADAKIRYANDAACELLGYTQVELESKTVTDIDPDFPVDAWPGHWLEMKEAGYLTFEAHHKKKSGEVFPVEISTSFIEYEGEEYVWAYARDITKRREAEEEAVRLTTIVEQAPVTMYITDTDGYIVYSNPHTESSSGFTAEELEGRTPAILKSGLQDDAFYKEIWDTISSGNTWTGVMVNKGKEGNLYYEGSTIFPVKNADDEIINYAAVKKDITASVKLNDERDRLLDKVRAQARTEKESQRRIQRQDRLAVVGQLASGIAHDFNNFMAVILLYTGMLLKESDITPEVGKKLKIIFEQATEATTLTQQILDFARRSVLKRRPMDLKEFLVDTINLLEHTIPENITTVLTTGGAEYIVTADPTRMQQVIMNLTLNARDAMRDGGELHISLERFDVTEQDEISDSGITPGEWVVIKVADTGHGISAEHIEHIFEPFFTTKPAGEGTGLGLAQVYGIMKQHGGHIDVFSEEGAGATFSCFLPISMKPRHDDAPQAPRTRVEGRGETILFVEDNQILREALVETLEGLDFRVLQAENGVEALRILDSNSGSNDRISSDKAGNPEHRIELVLSDLVMPEMGGRALLKEMRKRGLTQPFIILSGHPIEKDLDDLQARGMAGWMTKPPVPEQLAQLISRLLSETSATERSSAS